MATVTLIFPPATDPRSPHLAIPSLAAVLREAGHEVELLDLDVNGLHAVLRADRLTETGRRVRQMNGEMDTVVGSTNRRRLQALSEMLPERAPRALAALRDASHFHDPNEFRAARDTLLDALDVVSLAAAAPVRYSISPIDYDVDGVDSQILADLIRVTADDRANVFREVWETDVYPRLDAQAPVLIGLSIANRQQIIPGLTLARRLRQRGHFVVIGGTVFSKFALQLRRLPAFFEQFADGVVVYEGETAICELVSALQGSRDFCKVPNYLYLDRGAVRFTQTHVEDVGALATPDFTGLPLDRYLTPVPVLPILLGKGCYFNRCRFCDIPYINHISRKAYRVRSAERVVGDLLTHRRRFGCRHFEFTDEALPARLLDELATALVPHAAERFRFVGYARLEPTFTPAICANLARMGIRKLFFGLESGAQETLDHMDKGIRLTDVPIVLRNCLEEGIRFHLFSIVGFPEETEASARKTLAFFQGAAALLDDPGNSFDIHPFGLELRTDYADRAAELGLRIAPDALTKDFVIGVDRDWANTRGLTHDQVDALLAEFHTELRRTFRRYHAYPGTVWPAFEEFAVLYGDRYETGPFRYSFAFPDADDDHLYRLRWNPAALVDRSEPGVVRVSSRVGEAAVDEATYMLLSRPAFRSAVTMLAEFGATRVDDPRPAVNQEIRETLNDLLARGLLQLEPASSSASLTTPPR
jgi:anaerobic magnesium-protoporphyrin IX monomethyl ester cyclase